jgi:iron complex outermembrane receptor protein
MFFLQNVDAQTGPTPGNESRVDLESLKPDESKKTKQKAGTYNEVIVHAQKRDERLQDVPVSTKAFYSEDLKEEHQKDVVEVISATPSMNYTNSTDNHRTTNFAIRGISNPVVGLGVDQPVAVYVDDVFVGTAAGIDIDLFDAERVEILRGPQGTLYGKNALAGGVNIFSKQPKAGLSSEANLTLGNYQLFKLSAHSNVPLIKGKLYSRHSVIFTDRDGYVDNISGGEDLKTQKNMGLRSQYRWLHHGVWDSSLSLDFFRNRPTVTAGGDYDHILNNKTANVNPYHERRALYGASLKSTRRGDQIVFTSITSARRMDYRSQGGDFSNLDLLLQGQEDEQKQFTQELRWKSKNNKGDRWIAGAFVYYEDLYTNSFFEFRNALAADFGRVNGERETSFARHETSNYSVFGDYTWELTPSWELSAGTRLIYERKTIDYDHLIGPSGALLGTVPSYDEEVDYADMTPRLLLVKKLDKNTMTYASVSKGFKSGGLNNIFVSSLVTKFRPEMAWNYEVGFKKQLPDQKGFFNGALFLFELENQQVSVPVGVVGTRTTNADRARSLGGELELGYRLLKYLEGSLGYAYSRATFRKFNNSSTVSATNVSGNRIPYSSENSFNVALKSEYELNAHRKIVNQLSYDFKGSFYFDVNNNLKQPGYGLVNFSSALENKDWALVLWGKNILDKGYRTVGAIRGFGGVGASNTIVNVASAGEPATYGVTYRKSF